MKRFQNALSILTLIATVSILTACKKHSGSVYANQFTATVNGTVFTPATIAPIKNNALTITGATYEPEITVLELDVPTSLPVANTTFPISKVHVLYGVPNKKTYDNFLVPGSGSITFNTVDWDKLIVTGSFQCVLYNTSTDSVVINNGQFSVQYVTQ